MRRIAVVFAVMGALSAVVPASAPAAVSSGSNTCLDLPLPKVLRHLC